MWLRFQEQQALPDQIPPLMTDPAGDGSNIWAPSTARCRSPIRKSSRNCGARVSRCGENVLGKYSGTGEGDAPELPLKDRRFADPKWREQPVFALIHQTYLMIARQMLEMVEEAEGSKRHEREQLRFATRTVIDAMSPANFPLINPVVLERTMEKHGENLVKGLERLAADLEKGQLTHTDAERLQAGREYRHHPRQGGARDPSSTS